MQAISETMKHEQAASLQQNMAAQGQLQKPCMKSGLSQFSERTQINHCGLLL